MGNRTGQCQKACNRLSPRYRYCIPFIKRMENLDLIKRVRSELDQREVFVHLTEKVNK